MKYTTKQLLGMSTEELEKICGGHCMSKQCPFKKSLWKYRRDGFCIVETLDVVDIWIEDEENYLKYLESHIRTSKKRIQEYKRAKKALEKERDK